MSDDKPIEKDNAVSTNSRRHYKYRSNECLNCSHPLDLSDRYCPYCSQLNTTKSLSLKDFFGEFLNSIISYDSRLRYTLKDILFRPGITTRNYVNGQRLKYANPFRFFLSVSIIFFLLFFFIDSFNDGTKILKNNDQGVVLNLEDNEGAVKFNFNNGKEKDSIAINDKEFKAVKDQLLDSLVTKLNEYVPEEELASYNFANRLVKKAMIFNSFRKETDITNAVEAMDSLNYENSRYNRWLYNKNKSVQKISDDPYSFIKFLLKKIPFFLFFFAPFYALFFWLLYSKKKYTYMEHMVFIFHVFSFTFLALMISLLPDMIIGVDILSAILFFIIGPFYFYKALRNFYQQSRVITIIKFVFLNIIFLIGTSFISAFFFAFTAAFY